MEGVPLDVGRLLYSDAGRPRVAVFSIAHLSDSERMFFVSLLLNELIGWMRIAEVTIRYDPLSEDLKTVACRPRRADIAIRRVALMWTPD